MLKKEYKLNNQISRNELLKSLNLNILNRLVPVNFRLNYFECYVLNEQHSVPVASYLFGQNAKDIADFSNNSVVSGIIDFNKFINKMKELGYNINISDNNQCSNFSDYVAYYQQIDRNKTPIFNISANLNLENKKNHSINSK